MCITVSEQLSCRGWVGGWVGEGGGGLIEVVVVVVVGGELRYKGRWGEKKSHPITITIGYFIPHSCHKLSPSPKC
jgi:hypothetical protein